MRKETKEEKLAKWCAGQYIFSKADLMRYGYEQFYLRAWRTVCDFVTEGLVRKLTNEECKGRGLPTSMAQYEWVGEPVRTEQEEIIANSNLAEETRINRQAFEKNKQMAFIG